MQKLNMRDRITGDLREKIVWLTLDIFALPRDLQMLWGEDLHHHPKMLC